MGVCIAKDILQFIGKPVDLQMKKVSELMEPTYFVPETMVVQKVLEEMRKVSEWLVGSWSCFRPSILIVRPISKGRDAQG